MREVLGSAEVNLAAARLHAVKHGANIVEYGGHVQDQMAKNWYVAEVGDIKALRGLLNALRNVDAVFDAFRVTPS